MHKDTDIMQRLLRPFTSNAKALASKAERLSTKALLLLTLATVSLVALAVIISQVIPDNTGGSTPAASAMDIFPTIDFSAMTPTPEPSPEPLPTTPPATNTPVPGTPPPTPSPEDGANFDAKPPPPTSPPANTPIPAATGICERTPEVQDAVIAAIAELGPRMSCQLINPNELFRIRKMTVSSTALGPHDLQSLPNLRELTISIDGRVDRTAFANLEGLRALNLEYLPGRPPHLIPGTFEGLAHLQALSLTISPRAKFNLERKTFRGLSRLKELTVSTISGISSNAFDDLPGLINISLEAPEAHEYDQPLVPERLFHPNLSLQRVSLTNFQTPALINLSTPKAACYAIGSEMHPGWAHPSTIVQVNAQSAELMDWSEINETTHSCKVIIGAARIVEVPIPVS